MAGNVLEVDHNTVGDSDKPQEETLRPLRFESRYSLAGIYSLLQKELVG